MRRQNDDDAEAKWPDGGFVFGQQQETTASGTIKEFAGNKERERGVRDEDRKPEQASKEDQSIDAG